jgi:hypothetical protein
MLWDKVIKLQISGNFYQGKNDSMIGVLWELGARLMGAKCGQSMSV